MEKREGKRERARRRVEGKDEREKDGGETKKVNGQKGEAKGEREEYAKWNALSHHNMSSSNGRLIGSAPRSADIHYPSHAETMGELTHLRGFGSTRGGHTADPDRDRPSGVLRGILVTAVTHGHH